jgi:uncharacterized protein YndB with AHSA1/START domain
VTPTTGTAQVTLPTDDQILIVRELDAPPQLVFRAFTTPEHVKRWWGGKRGRVHTAEIDLRVGGRWRYAMTTDDGMEVAFHGEYREIVDGQRIVSTETYEGMPEAGFTVNTATFADLGDGRTRLEILVQCPSRAVRDGIIDSGMEGGMQDGMDLLERIAHELAES